jgi:hypothetical protein
MVKIFKSLQEIKLIVIVTHAASGIGFTRL